MSDAPKTLRDEFAMLVLLEAIKMPVTIMEHPDAVATAAYRMADAMMEARKEKAA